MRRLAALAPRLVLVLPLLLVAAVAAGCSGGEPSSTPTTTTSPPPTASTTPDGQQAAERLLAPLPGYEYRPDPFSDSLQAALGTLDAGVAGIASADVVRDDAPIATVAAIATTASSAAVAPEIVTAIGLNEGATTTLGTVAGQAVTVYQRADGAMGFVWSPPSYVVAVYGKDRALVEPVMAALIVAVSAP